MSFRLLLPTLIAVALAGTAAAPVHAEDTAAEASAAPESPAPDFTPRPKRVFADKPRIEDYADYNAFLVDIMEYRRQKQEQAARKAAAAAALASARAAAPAPAALGEESLAAVSAQDASALRELYQIRQPETLDEALDRARKLPHPTYAEPERFGRTTSTSFPIQQMEVSDMSSGSVEGLLQDLESLTPTVFRDPGIDLQTDAAVADNEDSDEDSRQTQANLGALAAYRAAYDLTSRYVVDTDGKRTWLPIFIDAEFGQTVIRTLDIHVLSVNQ